MREKLISTFHELDTVGLLLLGFGWSLVSPLSGFGLLTYERPIAHQEGPQLLLPFSLSAYAKNGYKNPSLIAMFVVGGVCLIGYGFWEAYGARFPSAPARILKNRTVITAIIIDVIYLLAGCESPRSKRCQARAQLLNWIVSASPRAKQGCNSRTSRPMSTLSPISRSPNGTVSTFRLGSAGRTASNS